MQKAIRKLYTKISPFKVNIAQHLHKIVFPQPLRNITIFQKSSKKNYKVNQYVSEKNPWDTEEKISFAAYCLLSVPLGAFILGTWQIQRYQRKLDLVEKLESRINQKPIELLTNLEDLESKEYCPVKVKGTFLYDKEFPIGYRSLLKDGKPIEDNVLTKRETKRGYHIITPFKLADQDLTILVNRGWIPRSLKNPRHREENKVGGETEIVGVLRLNETRPPFVPKNKLHTDIWHYRDLNAMAEKVDASPIYIEMISNNNSVQKYPIPGQTKVELRNEHINYILTWYCLCGATGYMWYYKFIKGLPLVH